jgi:hypothetical protein
MASAKVTDLPATGSPEPTDEMYIVRPSAGLAGSLSVTNDALFSTITNNIADKAVRFEAAPAPSISAPGTGSIDFNATTNRFDVSENGGAYRPIGDMVADGLYTSAGRRVIYESSPPFNTARATIAINATNDAFSYAVNTRQTFTPGATNAGVNVGAVAGDPSAPQNGDFWYNSTTNQMRAQINGQSVTISNGNIVSATQFSVAAPGILYAGSAPFNVNQSVIQLLGPGGNQISFPDNVRQIFNPGNTSAGLNVGVNGADPTALTNGDIWYNSTDNQLKAFVNGAIVVLA